jgi:hypothetical protein
MYETQRDVQDTKIVISAYYNSSYLFVKRSTEIGEVKGQGTEVSSLESHYY